MRALMVGGPLHGQVRDLSDEGWPSQTLMVARPMTVSMSDPESVTFTQPEPYRYELRRYRGWLSWPPTGPASEQIAYLCMEKPGLYPNPPADEEQAFRWHLADDLWHEAEYNALPQCVVPGCKEKARETFTAAEHGRLAGRDWRPGDKIRVCPRHGYDIRQAQYAQGMDELAEWLRPDATWDRLDALFADEDAGRLARAARMLRLKIQARP
jgi:hypothetical protein